MNNSDSWLDRNVSEIIKWLIMLVAIVYAYGQLNMDVANLKELRRDDKVTLTKSVDELKEEIKLLRADIVLLIKENGKIKDQP